MPAARKKKEDQVPDLSGLSRPASLVFGAAIVLLGGLVLASHYVPDLSLRTLWPLFLLVPIAVLTMTFLRFRAKAVGTLVPIVILTGLMVYFLVLNFVGWQRSAETWPVYLLLPGLGLLALWFATRQAALLVPVAILVTLSVLFFGLSAGNGAVAGAAVIAVGLFVIWRGLRRPSS